MRKPTLHQFITESRWPANAYVREPGFSHMYVRCSRRILEETGALQDCLDIANISVTPRRRCCGLFTRLLQRIKQDYPSLTIYVESVMTSRFADKLLRLGFHQHHEDWPLYNCFYLLPEEVIKNETVHHRLPPGGANEGPGSSPGYDGKSHR